MSSFSDSNSGTNRKRENGHSRSKSSVVQVAMINHYNGGDIWQAKRVRLVDWICQFSREQLLIATRQGWLQSINKHKSRIGTKE